MAARKNGNGSRKNGNGNGKKKLGRPRRTFSAALRKQIIEAIENAEHWDALTRRLKTSYAAIHHYAEDNPEFHEALKKAEKIRQAWRLRRYEDMNDSLAMGTVSKSPECYAPNATNVIFSLKTLGRDLYGERIEHEHAGKISIAELLVEEDDKG